MYTHILYTCTVRAKKTCPKSRVLTTEEVHSKCCAYTSRACELLLKIMAVLAKVSTLRKHLPSILVDPCLYYCCTVHQALAALRSLCTEGCARTIRSGVHNVIHELRIWTAPLYSLCNFGQVFLARTAHVAQLLHVATCTLFSQFCVIK